MLLTSAMAFSISIAVILRFVSGREFRAGMPPLRFLVQRFVCDGAQRANEFSIRANQHAGERGSGRLIHEWHKLIGESRHCAANANSSNIGASADAIHPTAFRHVTVHYRPPTTDLHEAFG